MQKISGRTVTETIVRLARAWFSLLLPRSNTGDDISDGCDSAAQLFLEAEHRP